MVLCRGTNVKDNFSRCFDHLMIRDLRRDGGYQSESLKVVPRCGMRTSSLLTADNISLYLSMCLPFASLGMSVVSGNV